MTSPSDFEGVPRIGLGTDLHRLVPGRTCILGGIVFDECPVGPDGHSDGDAVLHAVTDALLGAAGLDDLGTLFPDDREANRDRPSAEFVAEACRRLQLARLAPLSIDIAIQCDRPKIAPRRAEIRAAIARLVVLPVDRINVKGKTFEGLRATDPEIVSVVAVVLVG